jgi:hypothetical protein
MQAENMSMTIRDEGQFSASNFDAVLDNAKSVGWAWGRSYGTVQSVEFVLQGTADAPDIRGWVPEVGGSYVYYTGRTAGDSDVPLGENERYGFVPEGQEYYATQAVDVVGSYIIAPLPLTFAYANYSIRSSNKSAELMYTYRAHPFAWGGMELLAGVRYWDFEDEFGFTGTNLAEGVGLETIRALDYMQISAKGYNRVFGPQVGIKLSRQNAQWTFGAEGRFTGGINAQTAKTGGFIRPNADSRPIGMPPTVNSSAINTSFGHRKHQAYFSPIGELRLSADWQWTNAVSFFGAIDGMYAGSVARGVRVTDYVVRSDGSIFGIRGNDRNTSVMFYGAEVGVKVWR